jgi:nucleoside-diphosphate-sugar epimerase
VTSSDDVPPILLTGASGFIGRQILASLVKKGHRVLAIGRKIPVVAQPGVLWRRVDLEDRAALTSCLSEFRPSLCISSAWFVEPGEFWTSKRNLDWSAATLQLASSFADYGGTRFVGLGSQAEYGDAGEYKEDDCAAPASLYGVAKNETRKILQAFGETNGMSFAWARVFNVFGEGEPAAKLIPSTIRSLLGGDKPKIASPYSVRDFVDVRDVGSAVAALALSPVGGAVNIGTGTGTEIRDIVRRISILIGAEEGPELELAKGSKSGATSILANIGRLTDEVGFFPIHTLEEGLACAVSFWRSRERKPPG